ncbi:MAG: DNA polymerase III delta prime subunit [Ignavibacteriae bacterium]|nr:MAG: DNA polymerase III delta prime subunit [Ignavibacteriota bacterium]
MSWDVLIGQNRVKELIKKQLENKRIPHALLFYGPEGTGMDVAAIHLAKILNCRNSNYDSCDVCEDCKKLNSLQHPNIQLIFPLPVGKNEQSDDSPYDKLSDSEIKNVMSEIEKKSRNPYHKINIDRANFIKITSIREIRKKTSLSMFSEGKKVVIIFDADKMTEQAANALLKTLEEPVGDTIIILTTSNKDALLPTIISRCQSIRFDELTSDEISEALQKNENVDLQQSKIIARLANGSYSKALELINSDLNEKRDEVINFIALILTNNSLKIAQEIERISKDYDKDTIEQMLLLMKMWFRDALILKEGAQEIINLDQVNRIEKFINLYKNISFNEIFELLDASLSLLRKNVYIHLIIFSLVINLKRKILP